MATALQGFRFTARGCLCQPRAPKHATKSIGRRRPFSTTALRCQEKGEQKDKEEEDLDPALRVALNKTKKAPDAQYGRFLEAEVSNTDQRLRNFQQRQTASLQNRIKTPVFPWQNVLERPTKTFLNTNEQDPIDGFPDFDESEDADLTVLGHGELERHREMRHYARLAAWEMPMLSTLAKPFEPPTADMPLRFRYTTYMGEQHPAEKKVVLEFCTEDMRDLTQVQREKLMKLAGPRYNPETDIIKMSCEMFESQAQNKRYLGDMVETLLKEAKDPTDTFEDVVLDTRHHHFKVKPKFPKEWYLTPERQDVLEDYRQKAALLDEQRPPVDGVKQIEEANKARSAVAETLPGIDVPLRAGKGKGKGRTVAVRR